MSYYFDDLSFVAEIYTANVMIEMLKLMREFVALEIECSFP
jgi:hypothetical protein